MFRFLRIQGTAFLVIAGALSPIAGSDAAASATSHERHDRGLAWVEDRDESLDLAEAALRLSPRQVHRRERKEVFRALDVFAARVRSTLSAGASSRQTLEAINDLLFGIEHFRGTMTLDNPLSLSLPSLLKEKRGTCVSLVILYLSVAERVGLALHAAATPVHLFVRYEGPEGILNVETLEQGRMVDDSEYRRRHRMADSSIERGIFMRPLTKRAVLAHFLSNRGAIASREGRREDALRDLYAALKLYPDLEAAYYNRGLEHLKAGELEAARADLSKAIELHPLDAQAFNNRGLANLKLGDAEASRRDFEEAVRIDPGQREAKENLKLLGQPGPPHSLAP